VFSDRAKDKISGAVIKIEMLYCKAVYVMTLFFLPPPFFTFQANFIKALNRRKYLYVKVAKKCNRNICKKNIVFAKFSVAEPDQFWAGSGSNSKISGSGSWSSYNRKKF